MITPERDHTLDHRKSPRADCALCRAPYERPSTYARRCPASGTIYTGAYESTHGGGGAWARGTCPVCARRINVTRPIKRAPWPLIGAHPRSRP